jgi:hypothetical protein
MKPKVLLVFLLIITLCFSFITVSPLLAQQQRTMGSRGFFTWERSL